MILKRLFISLNTICIVFFVYTYNNSETNYSESQYKCVYKIINVSEIRREILNVSHEQKLIPSDVILKTAEFMIQEFDEDDPELIEFVKTLIQPPSTKPINLSIPGKTDFSQIGQSKFIDNVLKQRTNGFFVESGGYNGETFSNSLFFELERNWTGILIEPIPSLFHAILSKHRNIHVINACISGKQPYISKFRVADALSGSLDEMSDLHKNRIESETNHTQVWVYVPCFPLTTIMKAINVSKIDYFSLDIEGGEWCVIDSINFNQLDIETFTIEYPANPPTVPLIKNKLKANNFKLLKKDNSDLYLRKRPEKYENIIYRIFDIF